MAEKKRKVRFIHFRGRVIPIKAKDGFTPNVPDRMPKPRINKKRRQKPKRFHFSEKIVGAGFGLSTTAELVGFGIARKKKATREFMASVHRAQNIQQRTMKNFLRRQIRRTATRVAIAGKFTRKVGIAGFVLSGIGLGLKFFEERGK